MAWLTNTKTGKPFNTDWLDEDEQKKYVQIAENQRQANEKSIEDSYKHINPNFKKNSTYFDSEGYNNNCVKCALAFEANMREQNTQANPFIFGDSVELDRSRNINKAFGINTGDVYVVGRPKKEATIREIELLMKEDWGEGSRAIIQEGGGGRRHTMNVINQDGKVIIVDSQNGTHGTVKEMLKGIDTKTLMMFRTDDKTIEPEYSKWAYRQKE